MINVLHLSDLHFGAEECKEQGILLTALAKRENALQNLIIYLKGLPQEDKPLIIVISGDIGWQGRKKDYDEAEIWLGKLLKAVGLTPGELCVIPGNHDLNRAKTANLKIPASAELADKDLAFEQLRGFASLFTEYNKFCKNMEIPPYETNSQFNNSRVRLKSYLCGIREIKGIKFLALNSAWYHFSDDIHGRLWLGLPQLQLMNAGKLISDEKYDSSPITLSLFHHPETNWFNDMETTSYPGRPATFDYLGMRCHLMLSGHTHGVPSGWWDRKGGGAWKIITGASYEKSSYSNNCLLLKINTENRNFSCRIIEYNPAAIRNADAWKMHDLRVRGSEFDTLIKDQKTKVEADTSLLRETIKRQIMAKLDEKLKGTIYIPLKLERGEYKGKSTQGLLMDHQRQWQPVGLEDILATMDKRYILTSSVGMGKTTFLYWCALELINNSDKIPLILDCADMVSGKIDSIDSMIEYRLGAFVDSNHWRIDREQVRDVLKNNSDKLVLLFDGLDQIASGDYVRTVQKISGIASANNIPFIIASRPSAIMAYETDPDIVFIRLQSFAADDQKRYYGALDYERAKNITRLSPELTCIPMLAYMVKTLITADSDKGIKTRTQVYERFIDYIVTRHPPNQLLAFRDFDSDEILDVLRYIAFESLDLPNPQIQKVGKEICKRCLDESKLKFKDLHKYGLVNLIVEGTDDLYLYFTHQSFQEFLSAQYAAKDEKLIEKIVREQWNPKWFETLKFLSGIKGADIIKRIYPEGCKDNIIYSRLFLAVKCAVETQISKDLRDRLFKKLEELSIRYFFTDSLVWRGKIDAAFINKIAGMLEDKDRGVRDAAVDALGNLAEMVDEETVKKIAGTLENKNGEVRDAAVSALGKLAEKVDKGTVKKLAAMLEDEDWSVCCDAVEAIGNLAEKADEATVKEIAGMLKDKDGDVRLTAARALGSLAKKGDGEKVKKILPAMLDDKDEHIRAVAVEALGNLADKADEGTVKNLVGMLEDNDLSVISDAAEALGKLAEKINEETIKKITSMLDDKNWHVRYAAVDALGRLEEKVDEKTVKKISGMLFNYWHFPLRFSVLDALGRLAKKVDEKTVKKIAGVLGDPDAEFRYATVDTLRNLKEKADEATVKELAGMLEDTEERIRSNAADVIGDLAEKINDETFKKITAMLDDKKEGVRAAAVDALGRLAEKVDEKIFKRLEDMLEDTDKDVRYAAVIALGRLAERADQETVKKITVMLEDTERGVSDAAIGALVKLTKKIDQETIKKIVYMLEDTDYYIRSSVSEALIDNSRYLSKNSLKVILKKTAPLLISSELRYLKPVVLMLKFLYETDRTNKEEELHECWGMDDL